MVQTHIPECGRGCPVGRRTAVRAVVVAVALSALAGCRGRDRAAAPGGGEANPEEAAAQAVRERYTAPDAEAAGAWTWTDRSGAVYVLVDVQSTQEGVVQGRLDLWAVSAGRAETVGRSAVMPLAASFGSFAFEDVTGDGLPDFLGYVADSAETGYPVFLPGATGMMVEQIEDGARGWRFSADVENAPNVVWGAALACALRLWAEEPAPDSLPAGWRYLETLRGGQLGAPTAVAPDCAGAQ